jgi:hypothetical protein
MVQIMGYIVLVLLIAVTCIGVAWMSIIPYRRIKQMRIEHKEKKQSRKV